MITPRVPISLSTPWPVLVVVFGVVSSAFAEPKELSILPLDYAPSGPVEIGQILVSEGSERFDGSQKRNYPQWVSSTDGGVAVPGDGVAVRLGLSDGFEWKTDDASGPSFSKPEFTIFVSLFSQENGDLRLEQPGTLQMRWFTDHANGNRRSLSVTLQAGGKAFVINADSGTVNDWHDYAVVLEGGRLQVYVDGEIKGGQNIASDSPDKGSGALFIENYSSESNQYIERLMFSYSAFSEEALGAFSQKR